MKKRMFSLFLVLVLLLGILPTSALAGDGDISVTVRFSAPAVAEDLAKLRMDLLGADIIGDDTDIPSDITVTVPSGSTVKAVLEAAKATQDFTIEGLNNDYITKIGFLDETVAQFLANSSSNLSWPGWSFSIDGVGLSNGIGTDTVTSDGAVVEGIFSVYSTWDGSAQAMVYHDVELVKLYHKLEAMVKQTVDTSGFSDSAKAAYYAAKSEAEALLTDLYAQAKLDDDVVATLRPDANTDEGMWIGLIGSKGISIYGPGSPIEQLQTAAERLEDAAKGTDYGPCDLTALSVTDLTNVQGALTLKPAFSYDVTSYAVDAVDYQQYAKLAYVKATAASDSATITAMLGDVSKTVISGGDATNFNNMVPGENNKLVITVNNGDEFKTYTVTIPMKDADGNVPAPDPGPEAPDAQAVMDAIAAKYAASGIASDANASWLAADLAAYAMAFPDTDSKLTDAQKQEYLNKLIPLAAAAAKPGDLAKYIITLRAMGYDARRVVTADGETVDVVKKLTDLVDAQDKAVVNQYTLPYVLIALQQGADYATEAQIAYLKEAAVSTKASWQNMQRGTDGATPMLLALAPYCGESEIKAVVDETVAAVKAKQNADGSIGNAASTGLAMAAMAAVGEDCAAVKAEGSDKSLVDGLMTQVSDTGDGFKPTNNSFATEQGLRGLAAWQLARKVQGAAQVYDFAAMPAAQATAQAAHCPLRFTVAPANAAVTVKQDGAAVQATAGLYYDLPAGEYTYTAKLNGYQDATDTFTVSEAEAADHIARTISVTLTKTPLEVTGIAVTTPPAKTSYTAGERFDPTGMVVTATYDNGQTGAVDGYTCDPDVLTAGTNKVIISYAGKTAEVAVTVTAGSGGEPSGPSGETITVYFTLLGDEKHGDGQTHTMKAGNLTEWLPRQSVAVAKDATVLAVITRALGDADIPFVNGDGNYISAVRGLAELDNGSNSGWMYTLNEQYSELGIAEQTVRAGDRIVLHYTDDYTVERASESLGSSSGGTAARPSATPGTAVTVKPAAAANSQGEATATVTEKALRDAIAQAKTAQADAIVIAPEVRGEAGKISVDLPKTGVDSIAKQTGAALKVETGLADITLPARSLQTLSGQSGSKVTVSAEAHDGAVRLEVAVDGKAVEKLSGGVIASVPAQTGSVLVVVRADGTETIVKKSIADGRNVLGLLDGSCTVKAVDNAKPFADTENHWAREAVAFASSHELFSGTAANTFSPNAPMNRAMLATVLCRLEDASATGSHDFHDVPDGMWYSGAVAWASEAGIVSGTGNGFDPNGNVTREQLAAMLCRYAGTLGLDTAANGDLTRFSDSSNTSDWAKDAMRWAVGSGLISGKAGGVIDPDGTATRAEVAVILQRMVRLIVQ
ncbi:MAG: DUF4430 domain-containing protein [Oscillospiraceae bacterium]|nr:DUF4430 domain-containing protein [Oscillospiraceae bacterium]